MPSARIATDAAVKAGLRERNLIATRTSWSRVNMVGAFYRKPGAASRRRIQPRKGPRGRSVRSAANTCVPRADNAANGIIEDSPMHVTAIIAAGGRGQRLGADQPKQLLPVGGRPILERSVEAFASHPSIDAIVVALPPALAGDPPAYLRGEAICAGVGSAKPLRVVAGGERRQESVMLAFREVAQSSDVVVIHDAARPFASAALIARTI